MRTSALRTGVNVNKEAAQKWVDELMFGDHEQNAGSLTDGMNKYCALGVALVAYGKEKGQTFWEVRSASNDQYMDSLIPIKVSNWLGTNADIEQEIVKLNDRMGKSLPEIGTHIRDKYLKEQ
jgi:hypothetical protein